jgi:transcriptional regulator of acetoin/glycerol metabolism
MSAHAEGYRNAGLRPAAPSAETEHLVVVRRDRFEAFAVLAQAYAGEPGARLVWDRRHRERRRGASATATVGGYRRHGDRRASAALAVNDYLVFTRALLREPGAMAFVHHTEIRHAANRPFAAESVRREIDAAAESELPVLITGGDSISRRALARRLHARSGRAGHGFRAIDYRTCMELCERWISGRGGDLAGLAGGTVLIEEVAHWTLDEQARFFCCLERVARARNAGGGAVRQMPLRLITASACSLIDLVQEEQFRDDLFYRLNMVHLVLPSGVARAMVA